MDDPMGGALSHEVDAKNGGMDADAGETDASPCAARGRAEFLTVCEFSRHEQLADGAVVTLTVYGA
eukprot:3766188-Prymnesium_polylepis.1